jgi:hypothetical protein
MYWFAAFFNSREGGGSCVEKIGTHLPILMEGKICVGKNRWQIELGIYWDKAPGNQEA